MHYFLKGQIIYVLSFTRFSRRLNKTEKLEWLAEIIGY